MGAAASKVHAWVALLSIMSIIRGPIFISAVSLPVAIFAFCLRGILRGIFDFRGIFCLRGTRACGRSRRMRPPCSAVATEG